MSQERAVLAKYDSDAAVVFALLSELLQEESQKAS
jgi:hypothetical protein